MSFILEDVVHNFRQVDSITLILSIQLLISLVTSNSGTGQALERQGLSLIFYGKEDPGRMQAFCRQAHSQD